ncbi:MAG: hypothetical protein SGCHY_003389 [Lobulomycetales sp.]
MPPKTSHILSGTLALRYPNLPEFLGQREKLSSVMPFLYMLDLTLPKKGATLEDCENVSRLSQNFNGHPNLRILKSSSSAIIPGAGKCPMLRSFVLHEEITMPLPHVSLHFGSSVEKIVQWENLTTLDLDCPLLWTLNRFRDWPSCHLDDSICSKHLDDSICSQGDDEHLDAAQGHPFAYPVLPRLEHLSLKSLGPEKVVSDLFYGLLSRTSLPRLVSLELEGSRSSSTRPHLPTDEPSWSSVLETSCPALTTLVLKSLTVSWPTLLALSPTLAHLEIHHCDIPALPDHIIPSGNLAHGIVHTLTSTFQALHTLTLDHNIYLPTVSAVSAAVPAPSDPHTNSLQSLTLHGFGTHLPTAEFVLSYTNMQTLKLDDVSQHGRVHARLHDLPRLTTVDMSYTRAHRYSPPFRSCSPTREAPAADGLESVSLYAPGSVGEIRGVCGPSVKSLRVGHVDARGRMEECPGGFAMPALERLDLHVHGVHALDVLVKLVSMVTAEAVGLCEVRIEVTGGFVQDGEMVRELFRLLQERRVRVFRLKGVVLERLRDIPALWGASLSRVQVTLQKLAGVFEFVAGSHPQVDRLCISVKEGSDAEISQAQESLSKQAWWLDSISISKEEVVDDNY